MTINEAIEPVHTEEHLARQEAMAILRDGGAQHVRVERDAAGWLVAYGWAPDEIVVAGHTSKRDGIDDPRDYARDLLARHPRPVNVLETDLTLEPVRAVGIVGNEDETNEAQEAGAVDGTAAPTDDVGAGGPDAEFADGGDGGAAGYSVQPDATLHAEITDPPEAFAPTQFNMGDDLDRRRSQRIGDITRIALEREPLIDNDRLKELRNHVMGASEGRWDADPALTAELATLEADLQLAGRVADYAKLRTRALIAGDREYVEGFNPDAGWPE